ncbi:hypothetical protein ACF0H5_008965 [Mactra antiquata]
MEEFNRLVGTLLLLTTCYGFVSCDFCTDDFDNTIYCSYGCCGFDSSYCCGYTWSDGGIAGTVVGLFFFCFFIALCITCCRRRYYRAPVIHSVPGNASIAVVSSQQTVTSGMATGYAPPPTQYAYQKPTQGYPVQPPQQYAGNPGQNPPQYGMQPPAYSP